MSHKETTSKKEQKHTARSPSITSNKKFKNKNTNKTQNFLSKSNNHFDIGIGGKILSKVYSGWCVFDLEWNRQSFKIYAAAFIDQTGEQTTFHAKEYSSHESLIRMIVAKLKSYKCLIGHNITGQHSDIEVLALNAGKCEISFPIRSYQSNGRMIFEFEGIEHIDTYRMFDRPILKSSVFDNLYKSSSLENLSQLFLQDGKLDTNISDIEEKGNIKQQKAYVLKDTQLCLRLLSIGALERNGKNKMGGEVLKVANTISQEFGISLSSACCGGISTWWTSKFKAQGIPPTPEEYRKGELQGAEVLSPKAGTYNNVQVLDVASLYPTVMINYNISPDTINCKCCKDVPEARTPTDVLDGKYWICKKKGAGYIKRNLEQLKQKRIKAKQDGNKVTATALKIAINGLYGCLGFEHFKYGDMRAANLITAYGRYITFTTLMPEAKRLGMKVIAGDTDSLFVSNVNGKQQRQRDIEKLIDFAEDKGITLEKAKFYKKLLIHKAKNYVGILEDGNYEIKVQRSRVVDIANL